MVLGDANTTDGVTGPITAATFDSWPAMTAAVEKYGLIINGAVVLGVSRRRHPILWWLGGAVPLAWRAYKAVAK